MKLLLTSIITAALAASVWAGALGGVHKIYVAPFGTNDGAEGIRQSMIIRLVNSGKVTLVESAGDADAVLSGRGGQTSQRYSRANVNIYGGAASSGTAWSANGMARLTGKQGEILWTAEATAGPFRSAFSKNEPSTTKVAGKLVDGLLKALDKDRKGGR
jgi:hypothetical protein